MNYKWFIQFTAGRGPEECNQACKKIVNIFVKECEKLNILLNCIDVQEGEEYGYMSVMLASPDDLNELKNKWEGTIKYICIKNTIRPNHKRKNWFVGISFYEIPESIKINESDIRYETMRSSGAGGQNVNKVESAVRAIYIPTGDYVVAQDSRDQPMNKKLARQRLIDKLTLIDKYKMDVLKSDNWLEHSSLERGGQVKTFKGEL